MNTRVPWILNWYFFSARFPWTLAVENSRDPQRDRLQLRKGRTDHTALRPCFAVICPRQLLFVLCIIHLKTIKKTHWSQTHEKVRQTMSDLLHISLGVKKTRWFQTVSHPTLWQEGSLTLRDSQRKATLMDSLAQKCHHMQRESEFAHLYSVCSSSSS